jgi:hypothetical protein
MTARGSRGHCDAQPFRAADRPLHRGRSLCGFLPYSRSARIGALVVVMCSLSGVMIHLNSRRREAAAQAVSRTLFKNTSPTLDKTIAVVSPKAELGVGEQDVLPHAAGWIAELADLESLAEKDPAAALRRVRDLPDAHERKSAAIIVCRVIARSDAALALKEVWNFNVGKFADESREHLVLEELAGRWADRDPSEALRWAASLYVDEESRRDRVVRGIAGSVARGNPALAARIVTEALPVESAVRTDATLDVLQQWAARDYQAAVAWLAELSPSQARERGMDQLAQMDALPE